ncbi:WXG100 family type VII secretion target [Amycolatopsis sp. NPDC051903]|uniref:WXG100 family type VII secretion target n=1 Tax=Amycolatopsis sp. NPDC051903 TaxID=3363936 RepID=UPI00378E1FE0
MASRDGAHVDTTVMRSGAQTITSTGDGITGVDGQVNSTMESLFGTWSADSQVKFAGAMQEFHGTVKKIVDKLTELAGNVNTSANEYDHRDSDNTATVNSAAGAIGGGLPGM